jgi:type II secretion system protein I
LKNQQSNNIHNFFKTNFKNYAKGFTMVEVVVALAILSISLIAVFGAMRTCSMAAYHSRMLTKSVLLAESLLTEVMLNKNKAFENTQGQTDVYLWQVNITPTPVENLAAICVQVKWQEQQRPQQYELFSLIYIEPAFEGK